MARGQRGSFLLLFRAQRRFCCRSRWAVLSQARESNKVQNGCRSPRRRRLLPGLQREETDRRGEREATGSQPQNPLGLCCRFSCKYLGNISIPVLPNAQASPHSKRGAMKVPLRGQGRGVFPGNRAETLASPFLASWRNPKLGSSVNGARRPLETLCLCCGADGVTRLPFTPLEALLVAQWLPQGCLCSWLAGCSVGPVPTLGVCIPAS